MHTPENHKARSSLQPWKLCTLFLFFSCLVFTGSLQALTAVSFVPTSGTAAVVCADTQLAITFDATPSVGSTGTVKIFKSDGTLVDTLDLALSGSNGTQARTIAGTSYNTYPVLATGSTATIFPHAGVLAYNTSYYITVDATVFPGFAGVSGTTTWRFKTKPSGPSSSSTYIIVAADGSGDFCTVQGAIDLIPANNTTRRYINIRNGTYQEIVRINGKHNLAFRGQHRKRTMIGYPNNNNINAGADVRTMFNVIANDVTFDNLTLTNTTPNGGSQAEALRVNGQRCVVANCDLHSYQDTLLVNSASDTAYFLNSLIEGDVDFIWGTGRAVFQSCEIKSIDGGYICQMRNPAGQYGAVFLDCRLTSASGVTGVYLARIAQNNFPDSSTAFVNCAMDSHINPAGWLLTGTGATTGLRFWEYQSTNLSGTTLNVSGRASFSTQISGTTATALRNLSTTFGGWTPVPSPPAFPGAEGAGANTLGGRGGDVYYVTTLADSGVGSLRDAVNTAPSTGRTVLFKVAGTIALNSNFEITKPRITIAGQSAPGDGICVKNWTLRLKGDDLIVRHIRSRLGTDAMREDDAITVWSGVNVMLDHCSASWSVDEVLSCTGYTDNLTTQWCYVSEALDNSIHSKGPHGFGSIIASYYPARLSWHHNLYAHNQSRNPRPGSYNDATINLDFRNNVIYDWGYFAGYSAGSPEATDMNYVGNYLVKGPGSTTNYAFDGGGASTRIFQSGNFIDLNKNGVFDGANTGWGMFTGSYVQIASEFDFLQTHTTETASLALQRVISQVGARPWGRDSLDTQIAADVVAGSGGFVDSPAEAGGYPVLESANPPVDSDSDGMPNYWEVATGSNPAVADNNGDLDNDGYTNLEEYLNWLAAPHAITQTSTAVDVDLTTMNGRRTGLVYTVAGAVNESVVLLADGHTARFTPTAAFNGLGSFTFSFTALGNTITQTVGVCVTSFNPKDLTWVGTSAAWDIATTANFNDGVAAAKFTQGDNVTFDQTGTTTSVVLTGTLTPSSVTVNANKDYTFGGSGSLAGGMSLSKSGTGKLTLSGSNTYTGGTDVTGGSLVLGNVAGAGTGPISLDGAVFNVGNFSIANPIVFTGTSVVTGSNSAKLGVFSGDGTVNLNITAGLFDLNANIPSFTGTLAIATNSTVRFTNCAGSDDATFDLGNGTGNTAVRNNLPAIALGALKGGPGTALRGQSNNDFPTTFTIGGNGADTTFAGSITDGVGGPAAITLVTKTGAGTLTLSGSNSYTGATLVSEGTLSVTGSLGATAVTVAPGAALAGTGRVAGSVAIQSGGNILFGSGTASTLTIGAGLSLAGTSLTFDLNNTTTTGGGVNDFISLGGGALALSGTITIAPNLLNGPITSGTYTLISGGTTTVNTATLVWGSNEIGGRQSVAFNTATPGALKLVVTGTPASLFWSGTSGTTWDSGDPVNPTIGAANWRNGGAADRFVDFDAVTFDDTLTTGSTAVLGTVEPRSLLVNNATKSVTINSGSGSIVGATLLIKSGTGTLKLDGSNAFSGSTTINAGTIQLLSDTANASAFGTGAITLKSGTLTMYSNINTYNHAYWDLAVPAAYAGTLNCDGRCYLHGSLAGSGTLNVYIPYVRTEFDGDWSAFTGQINVTTDADGGEFRIGNDNTPTGLPDAAVYLGPKAQLYYVGIVNTVETVIEIGALSGDATSKLMGGPTAARPFTWQIGKRGTDTTFAGTIAEQGTNTMTAMTKVGVGTWTLSGSCSYSGPTTVAAGTLRFTGSLTSAGGIGISNGATLSLGGCTLTVPQVTIAAGGFLTGAGTLNGNLVNNGSVLASTGGTVSVNGNVTNNGLMRFTGGTGLACTGTFTNYGVLDLITGGQTLPAHFVNNGTVLLASGVKVQQCTISGSNITLTIQSYIGHNYQLQRRDTLASGSWQPIGGAQAGTGGVLTFNDTGGVTGNKRFYRILVSP